MGTVESLEIFVSEPIQRYNTYQAFLPYKHITTDNYCESLDLGNGEIAKRRICTETLNLAWKANLTANKESGTEENVRFHRWNSVPLSEVDIKDRWSVVSFTPGKVGMTYGEILKGHETVKKSEPVIIEGEGTEISFTTRPLKITGAGQFKRIKRAYLRGNYDPGKITFSFYGSYDMLKWWTISQIKGGEALGFPGSSFRFFRAEVRGNLAKGENLQGLSIQYL